MVQGTGPSVGDEPMDRNLASGSSLAPSLRQYSAAAHGLREGRSEIELAHAPHQRKKGLMRSDLGRGITTSSPSRYLVFIHQIDAYSR